MKTIILFFPLVILSLFLTGCTLIDEIMDDNTNSSFSPEATSSSQPLSTDSETRASSSRTKNHASEPASETTHSPDDVAQAQSSTETAAPQFSYCEQLQIGLPRRWNRTVNKDLLHQLQIGMSCEQVLETMGGLPSWRLAVVGVESNAWINSDGEAIIVTLINRTVSDVAWHDQFSESEIE
ncbi:outer membrane protein assembly factor BamE [Enterococcus sp. PF-2]|jgi:hypothetical protein|uniref:hypothetical protein n=1 Tax=unclassified Enterococcus TaxID=2608891 RepID=UPI000C76B908|nr:MULTISPECIES: hypothetical protein [unclassified Enterococcus]AUJ85716.1 hypothetical protein CXM95_09740 [Enterococcus sp. CR-Ec1]TPE02198.1 outer membrane protein assembly factor BamE [Enterococcus sp. PF-3]TPE25453.1 outer membrane protein assembly factor BamE [Enterococcus sp. PF-2]